MRPGVGQQLRSVVLQGFGLGVAAAALWWLARNTSASLAERGVTLGFDFLRQPAGFDIGDAAVRYAPEDSFARAILVGLVNTARVSVLGWILATALGFALGLMRLSDNPALRGVARACVELLRNTPLLLLLLFLAATVHALPSPRNALEPVPGIFVSDRGLVLPRVSLAAVHVCLGAAALAAFLARRRAGRWRWALVGGLALAFTLSLVVAPPRWDRPRLEGFNFAGGLTLSPELAALLAALVLHHGAHIAEVVRGAVLAVPRGQRDAAHALGLSRTQVMRFVVVPQALRAMVPLLATSYVSLTKNSSLAVAIGFPDVVSVLNTTANQTGHAVEAMLLMIGVYLALSLAVAVALNAYNARVLKPGW
ncbi:MAG: ABC transporter permease subunit [Gemmatimonadaceae bacterium]